MTTNMLAEQLRDRLREKKRVSDVKISAASDEQIIESYITCSGCGEREVDDEQLPRLIEQANNADEFFNLLDQRHRLRHLVAIAEKQKMKKRANP